MVSDDDELRRVEGAPRRLVPSGDIIIEAGRRAVGAKRGDVVWYLEVHCIGGGVGCGTLYFSCCLLPYFVPDRRTVS